MENLKFSHIEVKQKQEEAPVIHKHPAYKIYSTEGNKAYLGVVAYDDLLSSFIFIPTEFFFFFPQHLEEILELMKQLKIEKERINMKCIYCNEYWSAETLKLYVVNSQPAPHYVHWDMINNKGCVANKENINPWGDAMPIKS